MVRLLTLAGDVTVERSWPDVVHNLRLALLRVKQTRVQDLTDRECGEAVGNVADTLRTRAKGLIYEYRSQNSRVQLVTDELAEVASCHEQGVRGFRRVALEDIAMCVRYLKRQLEQAEN
ncbi:MAG: hypothetical protein ABIL25_08575, partial [candidate division WOR-3 bacterium]